jgi:hypothetical protein
MRVLGWAALALLALASCGEPPSPPSRFAVPSDTSLVVPGSATGPTRITFMSADPRPNTAVSGCGPDVRGCPGRVRMVFRLTPSATGNALGFAAFLHTASKQACFVASSGPFALRAGEDTSIQVVLDPSDECPTPLAITDLAANVEGAVEVASRQEWTIGYIFAP